MNSKNVSVPKGFGPVTLASGYFTSSNAFKYHIGLLPVGYYTCRVIAEDTYDQYGSVNPMKDCIYQVPNPCLPCKQREQIIQEFTFYGFSRLPDGVMDLFRRLSLNTILADSFFRLR